MSVKPEDINKDNSEATFKLLADVSKQNSDSIIKQTESITKLSEGQESIVKTLGEITETIKNVSSSDNNNPTGPGIGMEQKPKLESDKDIGDKTKIPNVIAPDEHGVQGNPEAGKDKGGLSMEAKKAEEEAKDKKEYEEYKEKKKADEENKPKEETKTDDKPKEEEKTHKEDKPKEEPKKEEKYKSFSYADNEPLRPSIMTKSFEQYPDGYQIIKAALGGWGVEGIDSDGAYVETLKRLDNREFGSFGADMTGGSYY